MSSFKDVIGHEDLIEYMQKAASSRQVSHAYILNGERGSGKRMLAKLFAMTLLCEEGGENPCNHCHACKQLESGNHPDFSTVTHEKASIGVDEIREQIGGTVQIRPYQSQFKIYVIPQADLMTVQAQNALLKTLEEPPSYVVIMLLTENADALLPTVLSRCVTLRLTFIKEVLIKKYLMESLDVPERKAEICAAFSGGKIGRAIALSGTEEFDDILKEAIEILTSLKDMELYELSAAVKRVSEYKLAINDFMDFLATWYRDVLLYKATKEIGRVVFKDQINSIKEQAKLSSYVGIQNVLEALKKAKDRLKANVNFDLTMELLFLTMKENAKGEA